MGECLSRASPLAYCPLAINHVHMAFPKIYWHQFRMRWRQRPQQRRRRRLSSQTHTKRWVPPSFAHNLNETDPDCGSPFHRLHSTLATAPCPPAQRFRYIDDVVSYLFLSEICEGAQSTDHPPIYVISVHTPLCRCEESMDVCFHPHCLLYEVSLCVADRRLSEAIMRCCNVRRSFLEATLFAHLCME